MQGVSSNRTARLALRRHARELLRNPEHLHTHWSRLQAALELPGSEPSQGALADIFVSLDENARAFKRNAIDLVRARLSAHVLRWFEALADRARVTRVTSLATRWSVLARPCVDISTRARRCSPDDSRIWAEQAVRAYRSADAQAQQDFFHHCVTCHDNLAFMLARRDVLRLASSLPVDWEAVSQQLERAWEIG